MTLGYSFIIKGKVGRGRASLSLLSRGRASVIRSSPRLDKGVFLSYMVKLGSQTVDFYVWTEHVLGVINLLNSLGRMWNSFHHCFIVWGAHLVLLLYGFVAKQASLVLWLSKPAFLSDH